MMRGDWKRLALAGVVGVAAAGGLAGCFESSPFDPGPRGLEEQGEAAAQPPPPLAPADEAQGGSGPDDAFLSGEQEGQVGQQGRVGQEDRNPGELRGVPGSEELQRPPPGQPADTGQDPN